MGSRLTHVYKWVKCPNINCSNKVVPTKQFSKRFYCVKKHESHQSDCDGLTSTKITGRIPSLDPLDEIRVQSVKQKIPCEIPECFENGFIGNYRNWKQDIIKKIDVPVEQKDQTSIRINEINMQMLSKSLHEQIFKNTQEQQNLSQEEITTITNNLRSYGINVEDASRFPEVDIKIPPLEGCDIEQHFHNIGKTQIKPYVTIIKEIMKDIPKSPDQWLLKEGWTRYTSDGVESVDYPLEDGIIFDVEVCVKEGPLPVLATAVTTQAWYGWVSKSLEDNMNANFEGRQFHINQLIPMESKATEYGQKLNAFQKKPKIVVGHNVSYDRSRIKEQYWLEQTGLKFIDTMSLHVATSGINSYQRNILKSRKNTCEKSDLAKHTSLNSLAEIYKFYCGSKLEKDIRDVFVNGTLADIRTDFNNLMTYCANDVIATHNVLCQLYPMFEDRFPHPVTLAGMLELGSAYLPTNSNWQVYLNESESTFNDLNYETNWALARKADAACQLLHNQKFKEDIWMWDEDWSTQEIKMKKPKPPRKRIKKTDNVQKIEKEETDAQKYLTDGEDEEDPLEKEFGYLKETRGLLPKRLPHMPGYPAWYRKLCPKVSDKNWSPGPQSLGTAMVVVPKLLNLTWENYPLHYIRGKGWGILVPHNNNLDTETKVPLKQLLKYHGAPPAEYCYDDQSYIEEIENYLVIPDFWSFKEKKEDKSDIYKGSAVWCDVDIDECCYFFKLPHKSGGDLNVGNPLAKDFLNKFSENVLASSDKKAAQVLKMAAMISYWRNNRKRIMSQFVVWYEDSCLPIAVKRKKESMRYGAIVPVVSVCGTLTRRAVESTWMTASNAQVDRIGSELRAMIQAPPGYNIVGADVDSQELWISSMIGDAHYKKIHGATPFGWMTLIGTKANETDMHSITAKAIGISRSQAKIINYARIYGAGIRFAERLLKEFNPTMTDAAAAKKSRKMFAMTKGKKIWRLKPEYIGNDLRNCKCSTYEANKLSKYHGKTMSEMFTSCEWVGGSESVMFNKLEEIAGSPHPVTPFLNCRLTRALENAKDSEKYLPTKVNWVVQSGAVDFLHLMLVSMKWLMKDNARFCLSFHDEVRYLVPARYKYNAALAMHITNLLTRSFCSSRLGMKDLPMSVAFFNSVEVDTVLRKESNDDCKTPSNPYGLEVQYGIPPGESLDVLTAIEKSKGSLGSWHETKRQKKIGS